MKITDIKTFKCGVPTGQNIRDPVSGELICSTKKTWLFVKVETDTELVGWGESSGEWLTPIVEPAIQDLKQIIIGRDPTHAAALSDDITDRLPWKGGPVYGTAIAGINTALYDIAGKAWGVPVHTILGGKRRDKVRMYTGASFESPEQAVHVARQVSAWGYSGLKCNPLETRTWPMDSAAIDLDVQCIAAVREAMGQDFGIMLDTHGSPTPELSIALAKAVEPYNPLFIEEPTKHGSIDALEAVARTTTIPIAAGEKFFALHELAPVIDQRVCGVLNPDLTHAFGITNMLRIAQRAEAQQILMAPHNVSGPCALAATLALDAAIPNFLIQEQVQEFLKQYDNIAEHEFKVADGYMLVPDAPGLGVIVKEQDLAKFPYEPMLYRQYRHEDGSWKGW